MNRSTETRHAISELKAGATGALQGLGDVIYLDDVLDRFSDDGIGLPPIDDDDDDRNPKPMCEYSHSGMADDDDFADLWRTSESEPCHETPAYYIRSYSDNPADPELGTYYYCARHFAANLGYLCDVMSRRTPEMEIRRFMEQGELPPRYRIQEWGAL